MNNNSVNGDSKIVMGPALPTENKIDIPPKSEGKKVIEEGEMVIETARNNKELLNALAKQNNKNEVEIGE